MLSAMQVEKLLSDVLCWLGRVRQHVCGMQSDVAALQRAVAQMRADVDQMRADVAHMKKKERFRELVAQEAKLRRCQM
jgi:cell division protein FtsB